LTAKKGGNQFTISWPVQGLALVKREDFGHP
jgi:hypothetical protein